MKIRIGIDPGKDGFITVFFDEEIEFFKIPLIGKEPDLHELDKLINGIILTYETDNIYCVLEDVHAMFGASAKSTFNFGKIVGAIQGQLISNKIPFTEIAPKKWQKQMWEGIPVQKRLSSTGKTQVTDTKLMSLMAAKRIFPLVDLRATERSKKPHDGKVDSLLIAEYCRRNF